MKRHLHYIETWKKRIASIHENFSEGKLREDAYAGILHDATESLEALRKKRLQLAHEMCLATRCSAQEGVKYADKLLETLHDTEDGAQDVTRYFPSRAEVKDWAIDANLMGMAPGLVVSTMYEWLVQEMQKRMASGY